MLLEMIFFLDNQGILLGRLQLHSGMLSNFSKQLETSRNKGMNVATSVKACGRSPSRKLEF